MWMRLKLCTVKSAVSECGLFCDIFLCQLFTLCSGDDLVPFQEDKFLKSKEQLQNFISSFKPTQEFDRRNFIFVTVMCPSFICRPVGCSLFKKICAFVRGDRGRRYPIHDLQTEISVRNVILFALMLLLSFFWLSSRLTS